MARSDVGFDIRDFEELLDGEGVPEHGQEHQYSAEVDKAERTALAALVLQALRRSSEARTADAIASELEASGDQVQVGRVNTALYGGLKELVERDEEFRWRLIGTHTEGDGSRRWTRVGRHNHDSGQKPDVPVLNTVCESPDRELGSLESFRRAALAVHEGVAGPALSVRQLLCLFGASRRGKAIVSTIRAELASLDVKTEPDFTALSLDSTVRVAADNPDEGEFVRAEHFTALTAGSGFVCLPPRAHRFCYSERFGAGKGIGLTGDSVRVRFFRQPGEDPFKKIDLPADELTPYQLYRQTRVYRFDPNTAEWRAGRIDCDDRDGYRVDFDDGLQAVVPPQDLEVRWQRPIADPTEYLAAQLTDNPATQRARAQFVETLAAQRAGCAGISALLSSSIELNPHQIEVVRRVLQDPVQRYLLADEVGLGKTIEAGVIIRQFLLDHSEGDVLIIAPKHLVPQWVTELTDKFHCEAVLGDRVRVLPLAELSDQLLTSSFEMLVVDEAHRIAMQARSESLSDRRSFARVADLARATPRLLLLSATPVLHNERGYLAMLHLIDPIQYGLDDEGEDRLRERLEHRQAVADISYALEPELDDYFLETSLDELEACFPHDDRLRQLCDAVRGFISIGAPEDDGERGNAVRAVRIHLSETYRLDRRLLRNRRVHPDIEVLVPGRDGVRLIEYNDPARIEIEDWLEEWRVGASVADASSAEREADGLSMVYWALLEAALEGPSSLGKPAVFVCEISKPVRDSGSKRRVGR